MNDTKESIPPSDAVLVGYQTSLWT